MNKKDLLKKVFFKSLSPISFVIWGINIVNSEGIFRFLVILLTVFFLIWNIFADINLDLIREELDKAYNDLIKQLQKEIRLRKKLRGKKE